MQCVLSQGDMGGPLMCLDGTNYKLVGVSSWHHAQCASGSYPVYTRVSYYRTWILANTRSALSEDIHE